MFCLLLESGFITDSILGSNSTSAIGFIQSDICHCGGVTEIRKIANYTEVYYMQFAPHNPNTP